MVDDKGEGSSSQAAVSEEAPHRNLSVVILGASSGRSTLLGHMAQCYGSISAGTIADAAKAAKAHSRPDLKFAYLVDRSSKAHDKDKDAAGEKSNHDLAKEAFTTRELSMVHVDYPQHPGQSFTFIDVPAFPGAAKHALAGITQADAILVVVDATPGTAETTLGKGGDTLHLLALARSLSLTHIVVAVSKMDESHAKYAAYDRNRYEQVRAAVQGAMRKVDKSWVEAHIVPVSGLGETQPVNVAKRASAEMPWYKGPCLMEALASVEADARDAAAPLRLPIQFASKVSGVGTVVTGIIQSGSVSVGDAVLIAPFGLGAKVEGIELRNGKPVDSAVAGNAVGLALDDKVPASVLHRGMIVSKPGATAAAEVTEFEATVQLRFLSRSEEEARGLRLGRVVVVGVHTASVECTITSMQQMQVVNGKMNVTNANPERLGHNEIGRLKLVPRAELAELERHPTGKPLCLEPQDEHPHLGRITLRDEQGVLAVGKVDAITKRNGYSDCPELKYHLKAMEARVAAGH